MTAQTLIEKLEALKDHTPIRSDAPFHQYSKAGTNTSIDAAIAIVRQYFTEHRQDLVEVTARQIEQACAPGGSNYNATTVAFAAIEAFGQFMGDSSTRKGEASQADEPSACGVQTQQSPASDAHEAQSLATQMQVEQAFRFAMQKCLPNWGDGDFVDGGNLLALVSTAIAAIGRASDTGIGNHASTAHLQDHALTPPASDADRSDTESG